MTIGASWSKRTRATFADDDEHHQKEYSQSIAQIEKRLRALKLPPSVIETHIS
jgi:hypothetical protein